MVQHGNRLSASPLEGHTENHEAIAPRQQRWIELYDTSLDLLLLRVLQELVCYKDAQQAMILCKKGDGHDEC